MVVWDPSPSPHFHSLPVFMSHEHVAPHQQVAARAKSKCPTVYGLGASSVGFESQPVGPKEAVSIERKTLDTAYKCVPLCPDSPPPNPPPPLKKKTKHLYARGQRVTVDPTHPRSL